MTCDNCIWYRYPMLTDNKLQTSPIPQAVPEQRRCERGWCDKEEQEDEG